MKKRLTALLAILLCISLTTGALAAGADVGYTTFERYAAYSLKAMGLMSGVSDSNMALSSPLTRQEALVMLIRLLGVEGEAKKAGKTHPFSDVDPWADPYVSYGWEHGLVNGVSATRFDAHASTGCATFLTLVLRALGYSDKDGADFTWDAPFQCAIKAGILPSRVDRTSFLRGDAAVICYAALKAGLKTGGVPLADTLISAGALSRENYGKYYDPKAISNGLFSDQVATALTSVARSSDVGDGINTALHSVQWHGNVVQVDDGGYETYGFYQGGAKRVAEKVKAAAEALSGKSRVFYVIAPNSLGAMVSDASFNALMGSGKTGEGEGIAYSYACAGDKVIGVDAFGALRSHNSEYIYLRTDHHWNGLGAYYAYAEWAADAGFTPLALSDYDTMVMPGCLGSYYYSYCGKPAVMKKNPDVLTAYIPRDNLTVTYTQSGKTYPGALVYDYTGPTYDQKYAAYLGGDHPLTTIVNNDIAGDRSCVVIKDSYGNAFSTYLASHYKTVYVLDVRSYVSQRDHLTLTGFADQLGVDDVIVMLSMVFSQSDATVSLLSGLCK